MAHHMEAELLDGVRYVNLDEISRCLHLSDFDRCYRRSTLIPHRLNSEIVDTRFVKPVLWFSPAMPSEYHNMYGNVSFTISMSDLLRSFSFNFYYIDRIEFDTHTSTRVLFTEKNYDNVFETIDFKEYGSPLKRSRWRHAIQCESGYSDYHSHKVEIAIEANREDRDWLYESCDLVANNHSCANILTFSNNRARYDPHVCHRYNLFGRPCPSNFFPEHTRSILCLQYCVQETSYNRFQILV
ncbi:uncharacterized protein LOC108677898 [Hyalella azteca]|uniref:Uncharacterized protein LOC108677898 n=1 Tax=Hyalella azteca TaxID=294128 RepID=A0A8B7P6V3_HYAAZ|nr:uncharacterized protein LOC108677898 [Hyalella azteca]